MKAEAEALTALEAAVSNALSAATEGGDYTRAPEPSDEPGSPYVKHIAASLLAAGVGFPDADPHPVRTIEVSHQHDTDTCEACNGILQMGRDEGEADARPDTATLEWLVDCAIRHENITASRGAEILGISVREMAIGVRERDTR